LVDTETEHVCHDTVLRMYLQTAYIGQGTTTYNTVTVFGHLLGLNEGSCCFSSSAETLRQSGTCDSPTVHAV